MAKEKKDRSALGVITETGTFLSTDFPLDPALEHRVRTGGLSVAERDADGEFRPTETTLCVRDRGNLVAYDPEVHTALQKAEGATMPSELVDAEELDGDEGATEKPKTRKKKSAGLEDQG